MLAQILYHLALCSVSLAVPIDSGLVGAGIFPRTINKDPNAQPDAANQSTGDQSTKHLLKRDWDEKVITSTQWATWYNALDDDVFEPLHQSVNLIIKISQDLERASFGAERVSKGEQKPNVFLRSVLYPITDAIEPFADLAKEDMAKAFLDYKSLGVDTAVVDTQIIEGFFSNLTASSLAFSTAAANVVEIPNRKKIFRSSLEATWFVDWAKDRAKSDPKILENIAQISKSIDTMFNALSSIRDNFGFLDMQIEDVNFHDLLSASNNFLEVYNPSQATVKVDTGSPLDPAGEMFRSRELPRVVPPTQQGAWAPQDSVDTSTSSDDSSSDGSDGSVYSEASVQADDSSYSESSYDDSFNLSVIPDAELPDIGGDLLDSNIRAWVNTAAK